MPVAARSSGSLGSVGEGGDVAGDGVGGRVCSGGCRGVADGAFDVAGLWGLAMRAWAFQGLLGFGELLEFEEGVAEGFGGRGVAEAPGEGGMRARSRGFLTGGGIGTSWRGGWRGCRRRSMRLDVLEGFGG